MRSSLEDRLMRAATIPLTLASFLLTGVLSPLLAQPAQPAPAQPSSKVGRTCAQIAAACKQGGLVRNGAKKGDGIVVDCILKIMVGTPQGVQGTKPLPQIDPQLVAACKQQSPNFGTARGTKSQPSARPAMKPSGT